AFTGGRVTVGGWIDRDLRFGVEGSGFLLERRSNFFTATSVGGAAPIVSIPFNATPPFNFNPPGGTSLNSGGAPTSVFARSSSHLWGAEINGLVNLYHAGAFRLAGLAGFRYLDLLESLSLTDQTFDPISGGSLAVTDAFGTRNQFYGGQIGIRGGV